MNHFEEIVGAVTIGINGGYKNWQIIIYLFLEHHSRLQTENHKEQLGSAQWAPKDNCSIYHHFYRDFEKKCFLDFWLKFWIHFKINSILDSWHHILSWLRQIKIEIWNSAYEKKTLENIICTVQIYQQYM